MFQFIVGLATGMLISNNTPKKTEKQKRASNQEASVSLIISSPFKEEITNKYHKLFALFFYVMIFPTLLLVKPVYDLLFSLALTVGGGNVIPHSFSEAEASFLQRVADEGWTDVLLEIIGFSFPFHELCVVISYIFVFHLVWLLITNAIFHHKARHTSHQKESK